MLALDKIFMPPASPTEAYCSLPQADELDSRLFIS